MKGIVRIGVSVVIGIGIILGALYVNSVQTPLEPLEATADIIVAPAPTRASFETEDVDNDGVPDWKEIFETIEVSSSSSSAPEEEIYTPPTTLTGKFSEAFLQDYLDGKMAGEDFSDPTDFVESAIEGIDASVSSKKHTRAEITIVPATYESVRAYGNEIGSIMQSGDTSTENEILILERAFSTNDESALEALAPIQEAYSDAVAEMLVIPVPDTLSTSHITLLNVLESMSTNIDAMTQAFNDPLYTLARISKYNDDTTSGVSALKEISNTLNEEDITYENTEGGAYFYKFDAL